MDIKSENNNNNILGKAEEEKLINEFMNRNINDPEITKLYKGLFESLENEDIAKSLINAVLPAEEVKELEFRNREIMPMIFSNDRNVVDIYAFDKKNKLNVLIEMEVSEKEEDVIGRAELSSSRIINSLYKEGEPIRLKQKIYSINFLYFDKYPADNNYYHHLYLHEEGKPNIKSEFRDVIIVELKKFKDQFTKEKLETLNKKLTECPNNIDKETERTLWFSFLSLINTVDHEPREGSKYITYNLLN